MPFKPIREATAFGTTTSVPPPPRGVALSTPLKTGI